MERALADESVTKFAGRYRLAVYIIPRMYKMSIMQIHQVTQIFCRTDVVVVGHNPENADYDNPRGAIFGFCGYVIAEAPDGSRWQFDRTMTGHFEAEVLARLETFVAHVQWQVKNGRKLDATHWTPARPCYGSQAYAKMTAKNLHPAYEIRNPSFGNMPLDQQIASGINDWCAEGLDGHPFFGETKAKAEANRAAHA